MFVHMVFFWMEANATDADRAALERDCHEVLGRIASVEQLYAGRPAMTPREVVDNSYDVGLCVILKDAAAHDAYQVDALHKQFIETHHARWQRVQVYDFA